jgi:acetylornithine deacetylase/succinyl-diaminopimelate desuccinylase-like protein
MSARARAFDLIAVRKGEHVARIQEYVRQPSVSSTGEGIVETANLLADYYRKLGCREVEIVPTDGHPGVFAHYDAGAPRTIVNYAMYDVQPAEEPTWTVPPFEARLVEKAPFPQVLVGRGAFFAKGPYRAWLNALESIVEVEGKLPVNVYFVAEGEEEIGSPHYHQVIERYADRLRTADACLTLGVSQNAQGELSVFLGNKGFLYFELEASGDRWGRGPRGGDVHGSTQTVVDSPAWRLVHALGTLTDPTGTRVLIDGFYDKVRPPQPSDAALLDQLAARYEGTDWAKIIPNAGGPGRVERFVNDLTGRPLLERYLFQPTLNIDGLYGGYTGPGTTGFSLPHKATANMDIRLVPDQEPDEVHALLRSHLDRHGYEDIEIRLLSSTTWAKTDPEADVAQACLRAYRRLGHEPALWPLKGTSGAWYLFNRFLGLPTVKEGGVGHGGGFHAANEYLVIEGAGNVGGIVECEQSHVEVLYSYAAYPELYD